jgi:hypothetical protein
VIWATGFRNDHSWIDAPIFDDRHRVVHRRGVTDSPGLYFLGVGYPFRSPSSEDGDAAPARDTVSRGTAASEPGGGTEGHVSPPRRPSPVLASHALRDLKGIEVDSQVLGLTWQYTRGSALIGWVADDAAYITETIKNFRTNRPKLAAAETVGMR